jgi:proteasome alpha subunit
MIGDVFTHEVKPMEVEILVAEVGATPSDDRLFHILYDGTVVDENGFTVLGGEADAISGRLKETYEPGLTLEDALRAAVSALAGDRTLSPDELEVAVLARSNGRRAFRRLSHPAVGEVLGLTAGEEAPAIEEASTSDSESEPDSSEPDTEPTEGDAESPDES